MRNIITNIHHKWQAKWATSYFWVRGWVFFSERTLLFCPDDDVVVIVCNGYYYFLENSKYTTYPTSWPCIRGQGFLAAASAFYSSRHSGGWRTFFVSLKYRNSKYIYILGFFLTRSAFSKKARQMLGHAFSLHQLEWPSRPKNPLKMK